ncbi:MAG: DNA-formamidopyrimidine glycosylase family protein [Planctomycetota bacterium]
MPELPEVECWGRRFAERACRGKTITQAWARPDETIVIEGVSPRKLAAALRGRTVEACHRHGKQMWWTLSGDGPQPLWHFGMSGRFKTPDPDEDRPKFTKIELTFDDGTRLAYVDPRRFGRVRLAENPPNEPPLSDLGPDALDDLPGSRWWYEHLAKRKTPIKALLLNQSFLAGIGNWIADEVLYQAEVAPQRQANKLSHDEIKAIRNKTRYVLTKACAWDADYTHFPDTWLFHHRWGKKDDALTGRGEEIDFDTVGGRTTAWVPKVQV